MEIDSSLIVQLIKGQEHTQTMLTGLTERLLGANGQKGALTHLAEQHEVLDERVGKVEGKIFWFSGAGTVLGAVGGYVAALFKH